MKQFKGQVDAGVVNSSLKEALDNQKNPKNSLKM